jgi:hypothetical protein
MKTFLAVFAGILAAAVVLWGVSQWYTSWTLKHQAEEVVRSASQTAEFLCKASHGDAEADRTIEREIEIVRTVEEKAGLVDYGSGQLRRADILENRLRAMGCLKPPIPDYMAHKPVRRRGHHN